MRSYPRMARSLALTLTLLVAGAAPGCRASGARPSVELTPAHRAALTDSVAAVLTEFSRRLNARDFASLLEFYADDPRFRWVEDGAVRYTSRADVGRAFEQARSFPEIRTEYAGTQIEVLSPDVALLFTNFRTSLGAGADAVRFSGALTATLVRTPMGWRFLSGHSSTLRPRP